MIYEHEMMLGKEGYIYATIEKEDRSFDHEFGTETQHDFVVTDFKLIYYIDGTEETDVTDKLGSRLLEYLKGRVIEDFCNKKPYALDEI